MNHLFTNCRLLLKKSKSAIHIEAYMTNTNQQYDNELEKNFIARHYIRFNAIYELWRCSIGFSHNLPVFLSLTVKRPLREADSYYHMQYLRMNTQPTACCFILWFSQFTTFCGLYPTRQAIGPTRDYLSADKCILLVKTAFCMGRWATFRQCNFVQAHRCATFRIMPCPSFKHCLFTSTEIMLLMLLPTQRPYL